MNNLEHDIEEYNEVRSEKEVREKSALKKRDKAKSAVKKLDRERRSEKEQDETFSSFFYTSPPPTRFSAEELLGFQQLAASSITTAAAPCSLAEYGPDLCVVLRRCHAALFLFLATEVVLMSATADISRYRNYFEDLGRGS
ncbi:hypothetical protein PIB30_087717 [Stylosanthes scabra]|uniref:Uncharacterized protein n=1 Tax=Stylosanthes scabra TaxID=79078 RepID=A0ABU6XTB2_9FABA|nr:hypothetical protein [Stylosanthes scabra]